MTGRIRNRSYRLSVRCIRRHDRMHSVALHTGPGASWIIYLPLSSGQTVFDAMALGKEKGKTSRS